MDAFALLNAALDELLTRVRPATVLVRNGRQGAGAGLVVGANLVLTNHHVVAHGRSTQVVLENNEVYEAHIVARDPEVDLALLEIFSDGPVGEPAVFAGAEPRPGEMVFALGHPWGERNVLTGGVLSGFVTFHNRHGEFKALRGDARLAPGNSGGPLLNAAGEVVGINAMIVGGDQFVAIPVLVIREFLAKALPQHRRAGSRRPIPEGVI